VVLKASGEISSDEWTAPAVEVPVAEGEGMSWVQRALLIGVVIAGCVAFVRYNRKDAKHNAGYEKMSA
jgi:TRAP-type C4-dicarboxylate transport system permease small subunit